jgi:hypothetical protein
MRSASTARRFVQSLGLIPGVKAYTVSGLSGYKFVGSENSAVNQGTRISDPSASEGALFLDRGTTVYVVLVITAQRAAAQAFLASFRAA